MKVPSTATNVGGTPETECLPSCLKMPSSRAAAPCLPGLSHLHPRVIGEKAGWELFKHMQCQTVPCPRWWGGWEYWEEHNGGGGGGRSPYSHVLSHSHTYTY